MGLEKRLFEEFWMAFEEGILAGFWMSLEKRPWSDSWIGFRNEAPGGFLDGPPEEAARGVPGWLSRRGFWKILWIPSRRYVWRISWMALEKGFLEDFLDALERRHLQDFLDGSRGSASGGLPWNP